MPRRFGCRGENHSEETIRKSSRYAFAGMPLSSLCPFVRPRPSPTRFRVLVCPTCLSSRPLLFSSHCPSQTLLASSAAPLTWQSDLVSVVLPEQALLPPGCSVPAGTPTPDECPKADSQQTASRPPAAPVSVAVSILPDNSTAKLSDSFLSGTVVAPVHGVASASKLAGQFLAAPSPSPATDRTNCAPPAAPTAVNAASTPVTMAARVSTLTATSPAAIRGAPKAVVLQAAGADDEDPLSPRNNDTSPFDAPLSLLPKAPHHVAPTPPSPLSPMALSSCQPAVLSNPPKPTVSSSAAPTFVNVSLQSTNGKVHADGSGGDGSDRGGGTKGGSGEGPPDSSVVVGLLATSARATLVAPAWVREAVRIRVALSLLLVLCQIPAQARAVADQLSAGPLGAHGGACAAVAREALGAIIAAAEAGDLESMLRAQDAYSEAWEDGLAADLVQRIVERMLMI